MEQRLGDLETQIERLTHALVRWRETEQNRSPVEQRLEQLADECAGVLREWSATSQRHAQAAGELESRLTAWNDIESRLQRDTSARFQGLERTIEREWASLRRLHEEPVRELREQAETLTEISVTAAGSAQKGIERAEARLAALEHDLHRRIDDLAREVHAVLGELRNGGALVRPPTRSWSLDEVTRLHHELREANPDAVDNPSAVIDRSAPPTASTVASPVRYGIDAAADLSRPADNEGGRPPRVRTFFEERQSLQADPEVDALPNGPASWKWIATSAVLIAAAVAMGAFTWSFSGKANDAALRASEAQERAERMATTANTLVEAARRDAATQIAQAREAASKAQVTTDVLAASDLVRFNLAGADPSARLSGQLLWSRSRGMVFTASRMPPLREGMIYQIWLLTGGGAVSAGTFLPDATGRVSVATDAPPNVPRPISGVRVTVEPRPASQSPSGETVLGRAP